MGGQIEVAWIDRAIAALAARQHGVVARRQLLGRGISGDAIDHRLTTGRLHRLHRGVYAVGHAVVSGHGRWLAAVLAAGDRAVLSHESAAVLWGLRPTASGRIHVIAPTWHAARRGLVVHGGGVRDDERAVHEGIPTTTVSRTILDLATTLPRHQLERAAREAEIRNHGDRVGLHALLDRCPGRPGTPKLRAMLSAANLGAGRTRSELEDRFLAFLDDRRLSRPLLNVRIGDHECDCVWPEAMVVVELDGREFHEAAFEEDRRKDRALIRAGMTVVRVTWRALDEDADELEADLAALVPRTTL